MALTFTNPSVLSNSSRDDEEYEEEYDEECDEDNEEVKEGEPCSKSESDSSYDEEAYSSEEGYSDDPDPELQRKLKTLLSNTKTKSEPRRSSFVIPIPKDTKELQESQLSGKKERSARSERSEQKRSARKHIEFGLSQNEAIPQTGTQLTSSEPEIEKKSGFSVKRLPLEKLKKTFSKHDGKKSLVPSTHRTKPKVTEPKKLHSSNPLISPRYNAVQSDTTSFSKLLNAGTKWRPALQTTTPTTPTTPTPAVGPVLRKSHSQTEIKDSLISPTAEEPKTQSYISLVDKQKKRLNRRGGKFTFDELPSPVTSTSTAPSPMTNEENIRRGLCERDTTFLNDLFSIWGIPPLSGNCQGKFLALLQQMTIEEEMRTGGLVTPPSVVDLSSVDDLLFVPEPGFQIDQVSSTLTPQITFRLDQNYYRQQFLGQPQWIYVAYENRKMPLLFCVNKTVDSNSLKTFKASSKGFEIISIPVPNPSKVRSRHVSDWISKTFHCQPMKVKDSRIQTHIAHFEENDPQKLQTVTFGVVNVLEGQTDDNSIFSNTEISPANQEFLNCLGETIQLKGWNDFTGGLDVKSNTKGTHSIFTQWRGIKIMFHVSALLPFSSTDAQQIERKNMIGNDIVVIVFKEGSQSYLPSIIRSHMNHVIVVVSPEKNPVTGTVSRYRLSCARRDTVPEFGPEIPLFVEKGPAFREMLLSKIMNGLRSARSSGSFSRLFSLPRAEGLCEIINQFGSGSKTKNFLFRPGSSDTSTKSSFRTS